MMSVNTWHLLERGLADDMLDEAINPFIQEAVGFAAAMSLEIVIEVGNLNDKVSLSHFPLFA